METNVDRNMWGIIALIFFATIIPIIMYTIPKMVGASATQQAMLVSDNVVFSKDEARDLFAFSTPVKGLITATGTTLTTQDAGDMVTEDFIEIDTTKAYEFKYNVQAYKGIDLHRASTWLGVAFYDSNHNFIKRHVEKGEYLSDYSKIQFLTFYLHDMNPPSNARYIRASARFLDKYDPQKPAGTYQGNLQILEKDFEDTEE